MSKTRQIELAVSRASAKTQIEARIAKARDLFEPFEAKGVDFSSEFERFKNNLNKWREFNIDLLKRIYTDEQVSKAFDNKSNGMFLLATRNDLQAFEGYKKEVDGEISFLESCVERLDLYDEPKLPGQAFDAGRTYDAFQAVTEIVRSARKSILLVDGFVDDKTLGLLACKIQSVPVKILTKKKSISAHFRGALKAFTSQHGIVVVRVFERIHDRFLIIDDSSVYQSGGSFKDLGNQFSTLVPLTTPEIADSAKEILGRHWQAAGSDLSFD